MPPMETTRFSDLPLGISLMNDGAGVIFRPAFFPETAPRVKGGPLLPEVEYVLDHAAWHWGETEDEGGEHVIDGNR